MSLDALADVEQFSSDEEKEEEEALGLGPLCVWRLDKFVSKLVVAYATVYSVGSELICTE